MVSGLSAGPLLSGTSEGETLTPGRELEVCAVGWLGICACAQEKEAASRSNVRKRRLMKEIVLISFAA
jgi:hypothetical protein